MGCSDRRAGLGREMGLFGPVQADLKLRSILRRIRHQSFKIKVVQALTPASAAPIAAITDEAASQDVGEVWNRSSTIQIVNES